MIEIIDHVGIAVKNLDESLTLFKDIFSLAPKEVGSRQGLNYAFIPIKNGEIELIEPTNPEHIAAKFIEEKGEGLFHISFRVKNIEEVLATLRAKGVKLLNGKPKIGIHGVKIAFINPESTGGMLFELCESKDDCET